LAKGAATLFLSLNRIKILRIRLTFISYSILPTMMPRDVIKDLEYTGTSN